MLSLGEGVWRLAPPALPHTAGGGFAGFVPSDREAAYCEVCDRPILEVCDRVTVSIDRGEPARLGSWTWSLVTPDPLVDPVLAARLANQFRGFSLSPVDALDRWTNRESGKPMAELPAALHRALAERLEFRVEGKVSLDWAAADAAWADAGSEPPLCTGCGRATVVWGRGPDQIRPRMVVVRRAVFQRAEVGELAVWRMHGDERAILCTDRFRAFVEDAGSTNIDFIEAGAIVG